MKKTIILMAVALLGTATMFSCKKKDNNSSSTSNGSMTATINNVSFSGSKCTAAMSSSTVLAIVGGNAGASTFEFPYISFTITNYTGAGTYVIGNSSGVSSGITLATVDSAAATLSTTSAYGTLTITATTPNITGSFSFTAQDSTKVTNGSFTAIKDN